MSNRHCTKHISGSILMDQDRLPCLPISVLDGLIRDESHGPGHHEIRLIEETDSPRAPDLAFPLSRCEARLPARRHPRPFRRPSIPTVLSWRKNNLLPAGISFLSMFLVRWVRSRRRGYRNLAPRAPERRSQLIHQSDLFCIFPVSFEYVTVPTRIFGCIH